jgi:hypothetical protein
MVLSSKYNDVKEYNNLGNQQQPLIALFTIAGLFGLF